MKPAVKDTCVNLDWKMIRHLYVAGIIASVMVLVSDMLLGYGTADESLEGIERYLSIYLGVSDVRLFLSALLGLIGIPAEALCYFSIYRLMADRAPRHARAYRAGILGYLTFGACGFHIPCLAVCYVYNRLHEIDPAMALDVGMKYGLYFMAPALLLFFVSYFMMAIVQLHAFIKGLTPYPEWCGVFSLLFFIVVALLAAPFGNTALANGISAGWVSLANLWMFAGLLLMSKKAECKRPFDAAAPADFRKG